jgi:hypothetical protein
MEVVSLMPRVLYPQGRGVCYPLDRRLGGPQSRSGRGGEEKNSQPLAGLEHPIIKPLAQRYTTELSRLSYNELNVKYTDFAKNNNFSKKISDSSLMALSYLSS